MNRCRLSLCGLALALAPQLAPAASLDPLPWPTPSVTLAWDNPPAEQDIDGIRLYQGAQSGAYGSPVDLGVVETVTLYGLIEGEAYFWAVTAYRDDQESDFSNEVRYVVPIAPDPEPEPDPEPDPDPDPDPDPAPDPEPTRDTTPPVATLTAPAPGPVPRRSPLTIRAEASDAPPGVLDYVAFTVNGIVHCIDGEAPYRCDITVSRWKHRVYRLQAKAVDAAGLVGLSQVIEIVTE